MKETIQQNMVGRIVIPQAIILILILLQKWLMDVCGVNGIQTQQLISAYKLKKAYKVIGNIVNFSKEMVTKL
jgi:hypothetical protein